MISLSQKQLDTLKACASVFFPISKTAFLLGVPPDDLRQAVKDPQNSAYQAYNEGKLSADLAIKQQEMQLAAVGSPMAIDNVNRSRIEMEDDE